MSWLRGHASRRPGRVTVGAGQAVVEVDAVVTGTCSVDTRAYPTRSSFIVTTCPRTKTPSGAGSLPQGGSPYGCPQADPPNYSNDSGSAGSVGNGLRHSLCRCWFGRVWTWSAVSQAEPVVTASSLLETALGEEGAYLVENGALARPKAASIIERHLLRSDWSSRDAYWCLWSCSRARSTALRTGPYQAGP